MNLPNLSCQPDFDTYKVKSNFNVLFDIISISIFTVVNSITLIFSRRVVLPSPALRYEMRGYIP